MAHNPAPFQIAVGDQDGKVVLDIHDNARQLRTYVPIDPVNAAHIGKSMLDHAKACGVDVRIEIPRAVVTEAIRVKLIQRVSLMAGSMISNNRTPGQMAMEIVDIVLREIA